MRTEQEVKVAIAHLEDHINDDDIDFRDYESILVVLQWVLKIEDDLFGDYVGSDSG